ncbi:hypothetical protein PVAP13_7KG378101 [Panicum virgatum]|uniref:Uncharacterized protein n=1 Tax=Panicum virgatum TaxID=38727 RepID=A0A8T0QRD1_PANVG|nr:hypothetical protein PVAP13_7KG378101 [Panicum virgatum]
MRGAKAIEARVEATVALPIGPSTQRAEWTLLNRNTNQCLKVCETIGSLVTEISSLQRSKVLMCRHGLLSVRCVHGK